MEYVIYLAKEKIDMLYQQVAKQGAEHSFEGKINIGIFEGSGTKKISQERNYFEKLETVIENISTVNSVFDEHPSYITGTMTMRWAKLRCNPGATFWIGIDKNCKCTANVLLIGSTKNMGDSSGDCNVHFSVLANFINAYAEEFELRKRNAGKLFTNDIAGIINYVKMGIEHYETVVPGEYHFLAKCLHQTSFQNHKGKLENYIVASLLYVAIP